MGIKEWMVQYAIKKQVERLTKEKGIMKFLENKKSFICWGVVLITTALQISNASGLTHVPMPEIVFQVIDIIFAGLGIGSRIETQARLDALLKGK